MSPAAVPFHHCQYHPPPALGPTSVIPFLPLPLNTHQQGNILDQNVDSLCLQLALISRRNTRRGSLREAVSLCGIEGLLFHRRAGPSGEDQEDLGSGLPGGEAMLELLTRLQKFQSSLNAQLEVSQTYYFHTSWHETAWLSSHVLVLELSHWIRMYFC